MICVFKELGLFARSLSKPVSGEGAAQLRFRLHLRSSVMRRVDGTAHYQVWTSLGGAA